MGVSGGLVVTTVQVGMAGAATVALIPGALGRVLNSTAEGFRSSPGTMLGHWKDESAIERKSVRVHKGGILHGAALGLEALAGDVRDALVGVVAEPIKGIKEGGAVGAAKGLARYYFF